jgi:catechol 2,3-dioxygenase-like lactoylglutathione lyase family enzyme
MNTITPLLNVQDVSRSLAFWRDVLGFEVVSTWDSEGRMAWARLRNGAISVMLNGRGGAPAHRTARERYTDAVLYFGVDDVHALVRDLRSKGVEVEDPESQEYGLDEVVIRDPDGYDLAFTSPTDVAARR